MNLKTISEQTKIKDFVEIYNDNLNEINIEMIKMQSQISSLQQRVDEVRNNVNRNLNNFHTMVINLIDTEIGSVKNDVRLIKDNIGMLNSSIGDKPTEKPDDVEDSDMTTPLIHLMMILSIRVMNQLKTQMICKIQIWMMLLLINFNLTNIQIKFTLNE